MQAIDRTAPILPVLPTTPARMTHDYVRHGTTSLFAAFDVASGSVIAQHYRRRWINEWNADPKPFVWIKTADQILDTLAAYCRRINDSRH